MAGLLVYFACQSSATRTKRTKTLNAEHKCQPSTKANGNCRQYARLSWKMVVFAFGKILPVARQAGASPKVLSQDRVRLSSGAADLARTWSQVFARQFAATIPESLGLNRHALQPVRTDQTATLPRQGPLPRRPEQGGADGHAGGSGSGPCGAS